MWMRKISSRPARRTNCHWSKGIWKNREISTLVTMWVFRQHRPSWSLPMHVSSAVSSCVMYVVMQCPPSYAFTVQTHRPAQSLHTGTRGCCEEATGGWSFNWVQRQGTLMEKLKNNCRSTGGKLLVLQSLILYCKISWCWWEKGTDKNKVDFCIMYNPIGCLHLAGCYCCPLCLPRRKHICVRTAAQQRWQLLCQG